MPGCLKLFQQVLCYHLLVIQLLVTVDYFQLPLVKGRFIFSRFTAGRKMNEILSLQFWHLIQCDELIEVVGQSDLTSFNVLNSVHFGNVDESSEKLLKARFIEQSDKNYPHDALYIYTENAPTVLRNQAVLNNLSGHVYSIRGNGKFSGECRYPFSVIQATQNQNQTNTDLAKFPQLRIGGKVMLAVNIDIQDLLINNSQMGKVAHIDIV